MPETSICMVAHGVHAWGVHAWRRPTNTHGVPTCPGSRSWLLLSATHCPEALSSLEHCSAWQHMRWGTTWQHVLAEEVESAHGSACPTSTVPAGQGTLRQPESWQEDEGTRSQVLLRSVERVKPSGQESEVAGTNMHCRD